MADLSSLNPANPADGEAVSQGASRIRDLVTATQTSMDVEHTLAGIHSFINGAPASRPAASTSGRLFIDTTNNRVERDTGSAWSMLHAVAPYAASVGALALTTSYQTLTSVSIDAANGASFIAVFSLNYVTTTGAGNGMTVRITIDGVEAFPQAMAAPFAGGTTRAQAFTGFAAQVPIATGTHAIVLEGLRDVGTNMSVTGGGLACFLL